MGRTFEAVKVADRVYWVGAIDWAVRDFHGYLTSRGTTYNAYLIMAEKVTLVDTVKKPFGEEMLSRIASVVEPSSIQYIISNHSEPDHTGALPWLIERLKPEKVLASKKGAEALRSHYRLEGVTPVEDGGHLDLGDLTLSFMETRMLHWPDSMFTYLRDKEILFSQDGFGMHLASAERFADELERPTLEYEAARYYANILLPYSALVTKLLQKVTSIGLKIGILAPDHGPIYRTGKDIEWIIGRYGHWACQKPTRKVVVAYDTMWDSTGLMARVLADELACGGTEPVVLPLRSSHRSDVATAVLECGGLLVGSPTINNGMFPTVRDVLSYLRGLKPRNLVGGAFGSYGWSGEAVSEIEKALDEMSVESAAAALKVQYVPSDEDLERCRAFAQAIATSVKERLEERKS